MSTVAELMVRIAADTAGLTKGLTQASSEVNQYQKSVQILNSEYKTIAQSIDGSSNKSAAYNQMAQKLNEKLEMQKKIVASLAGELQASIKEKGADDKATQGLAVRLARAQESQAKFEAEVRRTNSALQQATREAKSYSKAVETLGPVMDGIGTGFMYVGAAASAGFGAAISKGVQLSAQMEQTKIAFTTMLGSAQAADAFIQRMWDFASKTPFEFEGLQNSSKMLMAFGFQAKDIIPTMTAVGNAVAGLGGGEEKIQRVVTALGQIRAKGKVSAGEMMQLAEAGIPAWEFLANKIGKSIPEAMKLAEKGSIPAAKAIEAIVEGMNKKFPDMMKQQSETLIGLWSTAKDTVSGSLRDMGDEVTKAFDLKSKMKEAIVWMEQFKKSGEMAVWGQRAGNVLNQVVAGIKFVANHWQLLGSIASGVLAGFMAYKTITGVINAVKVAQAALNLVMAANPIAIVVLAVAALTSGLVYLYNTNETARYLIQKAWKAMATGVLEYVNLLMQGFSKLYGWIPELGPKLEAAAKKTQAWADAANKDFSSYSKASMLAKEATEKDAQAKVAAAEAAKQKADADALAKVQAQQMGAAMQNAGNQTAEAGGKIKTAAEKIKEAMDLIQSSASAAKERVSTEIDILKGKYEAWTLTAGKNAAETVKTAKSQQMLSEEIKLQKVAVADALKHYEQATKLKGAWADETRKLYLEFVNTQVALAKLNDEQERQNKLAKEAPWGKAFKGGELAGKETKDIVNDAFQFQLAAAAKSGQAIGFVNGRVTIGGQGIGDIPKFHGGGTFRAPTPGGEGLALLRDGEHVTVPGVGSDQAQVVINMADMFRGATIVGEQDLITRVADVVNKTANAAFKQKRLAHQG